MNETAALTGSGKGESMFIAMYVPRNYSFQFKRLQFQIILHFTITSNKSPHKKSLEHLKHLTLEKLLKGLLSS